jgi:hypothetical protein
VDVAIGASPRSEADDIMLRDTESTASGATLLKFPQCKDNMNLDATARLNSHDSKLWLIMLISCGLDGPPSRR